MMIQLPKGNTITLADDMPDAIDKLIIAISHLHYAYAAGQIEVIDIPNKTVTAKLQYGKRTYRYRISQDGKTVYYRNHQAKIA